MCGIFFSPAHSFCSFSRSLWLSVSMCLYVSWLSRQCYAISYPKMLISVEWLNFVCDLFVKCMFEWMFSLVVQQKREIEQDKWNNKNSRTKRIRQKQIEYFMLPVEIPSTKKKLEQMKDFHKPIDVLRLHHSFFLPLTDLGCLFQMNQLLALLFAQIEWRKRKRENPTDWKLMKWNERKDIFTNLFIWICVALLLIISQKCFFFFVFVFVV